MILALNVEDALTELVETVGSGTLAGRDDVRDNSR